MHYNFYDFFCVFLIKYPKLTSKLFHLTKVFIFLNILNLSKKELIVRYFLYLRFYRMEI
jgi:hypothetical protein